MHGNHVFCVELAKELESQGGSLVLGTVWKHQEFNVVLLLGCTPCACMFTCREIIGNSKGQMSLLFCWYKQLDILWFNTGVQITKEQRGFGRVGVWRQVPRPELLSTARACSSSAECLGQVLEF